MPEIMILFGTCLVCGVAGTIFKLQDWADERKARHMAEIRYRRYARRASYPQIKERIDYWG